mgnify:CR=1 FL=1
MTPEKIKPRWVFRGASSEEKVAVPDFFNLNNIPEGTARIMMRRGISTEEPEEEEKEDTDGREINAFLI